MSVFMPHHIRDQRSRIAAAGEIVKVDAHPVIKGIALPFYIDVGRQGEVQPIKSRKMLLHVVVNPRNVPVGRSLLQIAQIIETNRIVSVSKIDSGRRHHTRRIYRTPRTLQIHINLLRPCCRRNKSTVCIGVDR